MSAGELFDLIGPAVSVISAIASTWVIASARRRFKFYQALIIAVGSFFLPLIVVPLYLVALLLWKRPRMNSIKWRFAIPCAFLMVLLSTLAIQKFLDDRSVDAHLSRATLAKVNSNSVAAIREYREALKLEDSAHTRKLLAITLDEAGFVSDAITEFRLAEQGGEPDDSIHYRLALLFERSGKKSEAIVEFKKFMASKTCSQIEMLCETVRQKIEDSEGTK